MSRRAIWALTTAGLVLVASLLLWGGCGRRPAPAAPETVEETPEGLDGQARALEVDLYFPRWDGRLIAESREIEPAEDPVQRIRSLLEALLAGPREGIAGVGSPLPSGVEVAGVYLSPGGVAFLDLQVPEGAGPPAAGSAEEIQIVYSLVNTVTLNVPEARWAVVLWNGRQRATFAGHLDTSRPLAPNPALVVPR